MKRNKFSLSHYRLLTCDMGALVPIGCMEVLPGDTVQHATSALLRVSPLVAPVMHPVHVRIHHWFVPNRLIWDDWEEFITGGDGFTTPPVWPYREPNSIVEGSLGDYFGMPVGFEAIPVSALPLRAYGLIWNEFYRDQDLQDEVVISTDSGEDTTTGISFAQLPYNVCWEKDYFTSARPWPQKGADVTIPMGATQGNGPFTMTDGVSGNTAISRNASDQLLMVDSGGAVANTFYVSGIAATGGTINELREAMALQRYAEARARYGSRYTEYLRYLGIRSSDARLQRPEYLGGGRQTIQFSEVLQSSETGTTPLGTMGGHGIGAMRSNRYRRFFEEHGLVMSFISVKPKTIYADGLERMWFRETKEDYFQRELQHIGQQEIYNKEIYAMSADPDGTFGYQDRYAEYRHKQSFIHGEFRDSLNYWHMARLFGSEPVLNDSFVTSIPTKRVLASQDTDALYIMANHSIQARRMISAGGNPGGF